MFCLFQQIYGVSFKDYINMLLDAGIIDICILALKLRVKLPEYEKQREDPEGDVWEAIYYYCVSIVGHVIISCYWENSKAKVAVKKRVATSEFVDVCLAFVKGDKFVLINFLKSTQTIVRLPSTRE